MLRLTPHTLRRRGFEMAGRFARSSASATRIELRSRKRLDRVAGVYAVVVDEQVVYVGVSDDLRWRINSWCQSSRETTQWRLEAQFLLRQALRGGQSAHLLVLLPPQQDWFGLSYNLAHSLEHALIKTFRPPWNRTGPARPPPPP